MLLSLKYSQQRWFIFFQSSPSTPFILLFSQPKIKGDSSGRLTLVLLSKRLSSFGFSF